MEEIAKMLVGTSPIAAVLLLLGTQFLSVWKADLATANVKRDTIIERLDDLTRRVKLLEVEATGDESPTEHKRPKQLA